MSTYTPDVWVVIRITNSDGEVVDKVLAGWSGSYLGGASWKLNSGITKVVEKENHYVVSGYSGSDYICHKGAERLSAYTADILAGFVETSKDHATIKVVPIETVLKEQALQ
jgi:hypothetical protein